MSRDLVTQARLCCVLVGDPETSPEPPDIATHLTTRDKDHLIIIVIAPVLSLTMLSGLKMEVCCCSYVAGGGCVCLCCGQTGHCHCRWVLQGSGN